MSKNDDKQNVYNQVAWILNYQPKIEHQHIHMGSETQEAKPCKSFATAVVDVAKAEAVISLLRQLMAGKQKPKDVMMPVRAAIEAGVIRRPTWEEFCSEFGTDLLKSKASFSDYTNPDRSPYEGEDFESMKRLFQSL